MSRFIFLDRDGTIIKDKYHMYKQEDIEFLPKAVSGLQKLQRAGYEFFIVSNQAGVAKGYFSPADAYHFHSAFLTQLRRHQITIKESYFCFHREEDNCICRKPKPGLVRKAKDTFHVSLETSIFIGDKDCDIQLGLNCGGTTFRIDNNQYRSTVAAHHRVRNLEQVYSLLSALK